MEDWEKRFESINRRWNDDMKEVSRHIYKLDRSIIHSFESLRDVTSRVIKKGIENFNNPDSSLDNLLLGVLNPGQIVNLRINDLNPSLLRRLTKLPYQVTIGSSNDEFQIIVGDKISNKYPRKWKNGNLFLTTRTEGGEARPTIDELMVSASIFRYNSKLECFLIHKDGITKFVSPYGYSALLDMQSEWEKNNNDSQVNYVNDQTLNVIYEDKISWQEEDKIDTLVAEMRLLLQGKDPNID